MEESYGSFAGVYDLFMDNIDYPAWCTYLIGILKEYGIEDCTPEEWEDAVYHGMKTEIHTMATLNDTFIGNIHRQLTTRHMHFTATEATEGCIPQPTIEGVLKVTILVFSVLLDNTDYQLTVRAR